MVTSIPEAKIADKDTIAVGTKTYEVDFKFSASAAIYSKWSIAGITGSIIAQWSANGSDWVNIGSAGNLAAVGVYTAEVENKGYHYLRLLVTVGSGTLSSLEAWYNAKG